MIPACGQDACGITRNSLPVRRILQAAVIAPIRALSGIVGVPIGPMFLRAQKKGLECMPDEMFPGLQASVNRLYPLPIRQCVQCGKCNDSRV